MKHFFILLNIFTLFTWSVQAAPTIAMEKNEKNIKFHLDFDKPVKYEMQRTNNELIIEFNQAIDGLEASSVYKSLPEWVKEFSYSYDKIVILTEDATDFQVVANNDKLSIEVYPKNITAPSTTLSSANALILGKEFIKAEELLRKHLDVNKNDTYAMSLYAQAHQGLYNYPAAIETYFDILEKLPNDVGTHRAKQYAFSQIASVAEVGFEFVDYDDDETQSILSYSLSALNAAKTSLLVSGTLNKVNVDNIQEIDGTISNYNDDYYNNLAISLLYKQSYDFNIMPSVYFGNYIVGGGIAFIKRLVNEGILSLSFDYNKPDFDSSRQIVLSASTDNATISYQSNFFDNWYWSAQVGYVNHNYRAKKNVAKSIDTLATISYEFLPIKQDILIASYAISGRYFLDNEEGIDTFGTPFKYSTSSTSEVHSITLLWNARMPHDITFSPFVGYAYDRYNKGGEIYGIRFLKEEFNRHDIEFYAEKGVSTYDGSNRDVYSLGMNFSLKF